MSEKAKQIQEKMQSHGARSHHPFSPSSLQNREACPFFENQSGTTNAAALEGTSLHEMTETGKDNPEIDDYLAKLSADCLALEKQIKERFPGGTFLAEQELVVDKQPIRYLNEKGKLARNKTTTGGYPDFAAVSSNGKSGVILDWKFGEWEVEEAENNLQGIAYALGLRHAYPTLESVEVIFAMPKLDLVSSHTFNSGEFDDLYLRVRRTVEGAIHARELMAEAKRQTGGIFQGGNPHTGLCMFCANIGRCEAVASKVIRIASKFSQLDFPVDEIMNLMSDPVLAGKAMAAATAAEGWAKSLRVAMLDKTIESEDDWIPEGYELSTRSEREIVNVSGVEEVAKSFGVSQESLNAAKSLSITAVEKAITKVTPRGKKSAVVEEFKTTTEDLEHVKKGEPYSFLKVSKKKKEH